jgi:adenylosuccinate lyase
MIEAVKLGADRQEMHELMRDIAMQAWDEVQDGNTNPMANLLEEDATLLRYLSKGEITKLLDVSHHVGDAPERSRKLVQLIKKAVHEK